MGRRTVRLAVLVTLGMFAACATTTDPATDAPTGPTADASADRSVGKETGAIVDVDAGDEDAPLETDAGKDATPDTASDTGTGADTAVGDANAGTDADGNETGTDEAGTDAAVADAADAADAATASDAADAAPSADASDGAPPPDAATVDAGCNNLAYGSPELTIDQVASSAPNALGGNVANGTYHLSSYSKFTGAGGTTGPGTLTLRSTVRITGNAIDRLIADYTGIEKRQSGTFVTGPTTGDIAITWTCGGGGTESGTYSAAQNKFAYYQFTIYEAVHTK